ncbi:bifunctional 3,4-dihydroxy-2-butanone-4-phosphate synthase/GTP cyclohydrolase II [Paraburkholderia silviterrae]|uniref:Riboflavin biosynthesis protein RibBA n=1 Tax=Paraburkholderia silviterrae TaxID=2528715 RepID=A0A4R5MFB9_9BURK|nr:bifunctional 3,4-dihydroxy-2-butanone-4-phosphate synthase/GTP cyclohydrolase II [Paraburkholderia silviterrae]TDG25959.1 bifunctional 3,4-dihydroxy-2-butanone-4-phosphate synthase/GTP cyclohydrolase II [Paraburkholderia silviterrae]
MKTDSIETAIEAIAAGRMVVVVDDEDRENEGDLIMAAQAATDTDIAFMVRYTSGVLCVSLSGERLDALSLPLMVANNSDSMSTAFTVSTDYRIGTTTGISAADRAITVRALVDEKAEAVEFSRPGHVFPLRAVRGGVLRRPGHTEAGVDLTRLAGMAPGGLLAEIVNDDGTMARFPQLVEFARAHSLPIITIKDLIAYRRKRERIVERMSMARLPTRYGVFTVFGYREISSGQEHAALVMGDLASCKSPLVRVHSECLTGEVFGSIRCDCRAQLDLAMERIAQAGCGIVVYLKGHEGRGIGLTEKLRAYALQDKGLDTVEANLQLGLQADARDYAVGAQILQDQGVTTMKLMTNNPRKYRGISEYGLSIEDRVPLVTVPNRENAFYLKTKEKVLGHIFD